MANIVITSTTNSIKVDFGVLGTGNLPKKGAWEKDKIIKIELLPSDAFVKITNLGENEWQVSYDGNNGMQIDSVDGVAPTSNSDLYDKLIALIA
jgi:hypothetical protein